MIKRINLTKEELIELKRCHKAIKVGKEKDKIKAILLLDKGYSYTKIAEILLIEDDTVKDWEKDFKTRKNIIDWLSTKCIGYQGKLEQYQEERVVKYIENNIISDSKQVIKYIKEEFKIKYSTSGIVNFLKRLGFVYKQTSLIPAKYDQKAQEEFKKQYEAKEANLSKDEVLLFADGVHPQHNTKSSRAWIKKAQKKEIKSNTGRSRININGVYNPHNQDLIVIESQTINAQSTIELFQKVEKYYANKNIIYIIVDNAKYYKNSLLKKYLSNSKINLIFLPPYSPNLNLIERLWKLMRKKTINSQYYEKFKDFRIAVFDFLNNCSHNSLELKKFIGTKMHLLSSS